MSKHQSLIKTCKKQRGSGAFTICFPLDHDTCTLVAAVINQLLQSQLSTVLITDYQRLQFFTGIQHNAPLHQLKEVSLTHFTNQPSGFFLCFNGKIFEINEHLKNELCQVTDTILSIQCSKFYEIKCEDILSKEPKDNKDTEFEFIRKKSFRASYEYYLTNRGGKKHLIGKPVSLKRKHQSAAERNTGNATLKKNQVSLVLSKYRQLPNQKSKQYKLKSNEKGDVSTKRTRDAKQYEALSRQRIIFSANSSLKITQKDDRLPKDTLRTSLRNYLKTKKRNTDYKVQTKKSFGAENDEFLHAFQKRKKDDDEDDYRAFLRERTNLPNGQLPIPTQELVVCPAKKSKKSSSRGQASGQNQDRIAQVSESETPDTESRPSSRNIVTSTISIFQQNQYARYPPPTTNSMSYASEQALVNRLRGMRNRPHGRAPPPAKHPQYADAANRRSSYGHWPTTSRQDPSIMANYGFFFTGRADLVRCFQCGIGLKDWSEPDEPLFEHIKHSPDCSFLLQLLGPELLAAYKVNLIPGHAQPTAARPPPVEGDDFTGRATGATGEDVATGTSGGGTVGGATGGIAGGATGTTGGATAAAESTGGAVRSPQFAELSARLRSFNSFDRSISQTPLEIAEAGFYYTGEGDICRCFTCDGGLTHWDPQDDPWVEHAKWFPQCSFVRQIKGDEYVNLIQQAIASTDDENTQGIESSVRGRMANLSVDTHSNPLSLPAAQTAIEMGFSKKAVTLAIHELIAKNQQNYGAEDIVAILTSKQERGEALPVDTPPNERANPSDEKGDVDEKQQLQEDNQRLRQILKCMMCEERLVNTLFLPCTHHRLCQECAANVSMCPVCGRTVEEKVRTYMA